MMPGTYAYKLASIITLAGYAASVSINRPASQPAINQASPNISSPPTLNSTSANVTIQPPVPDPYIWHQPDMSTTWSFEEFRGRVNMEACKVVWYNIWGYATWEVNQGRRNWPFTRLPIFPRKYRFEWILGGRTLETWLYPTWKCTNKMVEEGSRLLSEGVQGAARACERGQEFRFEVWAGNRFVMWGETRTVRD